MGTETVQRFQGLRGNRWLIAIVAITSVPVLVVAGVLMLVLWCPALLLVHLLAWTTWSPRRIAGVMVYSNSPNWQQDMEETVLPAIRERMIILNWSERRLWRNTLAVWCFRLVNFGGRKNFNPMAIVFQRWRPLKTVRFFAAYRGAKHGNGRELELKKQQLFELIR